jgi:hypothetical protein
MHACAATVSSVAISILAALTVVIHGLAITAVVELVTDEIVVARTAAAVPAPNTATVLPTSPATNAAVADVTLVGLTEDEQAAFDTVR